MDRMKIVDPDSYVESALNCLNQREAGGHI